MQHYKTTLHSSLYIPLKQQVEHADDEQTKQLNSICSMLLSAGYFRTRVKGRTYFDRVNIIVVLLFTTIYIISYYL